MSSRRGALTTRTFPYEIQSCTDSFEFFKSIFFNVHIILHGILTSSEGLFTFEILTQIFTTYTLALKCNDVQFSCISVLQLARELNGIICNGL